MKKLLSKKGSSTLTFAIILMIILSSIALLTTYIVGRNANISVRNVNNKYEYILLENDLYEELNYRLENSDFRKETTNGYTVFVSKSSGNYIVEISNNTLKISATVEFNDDNYKILGWSKNYA